MASDTSSDIDIPFFDNHGNNIQVPPFKKETSETDLYLNLIANPVKSREDTENSTSSLNLGNNDNKKNDSDTSSVRQSYRNDSHKNTFMHSATHKDYKDNSYSSDRHHSHRSHRSNRSNHSNHSRSTESSKARFDNVDLTHSAKDSDYEPPAPKLTPQQLRMKKIDLLRKLCDLKTKGYKLTKEYDFNSSIEEMEYEYDLLKSFADRRNGIKLYKNTIINITNLVEFFNDKYDPFGVQLSGWSEHMSVEVDSYDDVLEELYEKYKGAGKNLPPEIKLLILIGFSASAFHFSKKHMSNIPMGTAGIGSLQSGIAQKIASMVKPEESKFMSEQELNIKRQKEELREKDRMQKEMLRNNMMQSQVPQAPQVPQVPQQMPNIQPQQVPKPQNQQSPTLMNARASVNFPTQNQPNSFFNPGGPPNPLIQNKDPRPLIQTNESVRDVLNRLHNRDADTQDTQEESTINNDRLLSDTTASESKKKGKKKKPLMKIQ